MKAPNSQKASSIPGLHSIHAPLAQKQKAPEPVPLDRRPKMHPFQPNKQTTTKEPHLSKDIARYQFPPFPQKL